MGIQAQMLLNEEDIRKQREREAVRRQGFEFIKILWAGRPSSPETLRIHGIKDIQVREEPDYENPGSIKLTPYPASGTTQFDQDAVTGLLTCHVWDDPEGYNRHFIAQHLDFGFDLEDKELKAELRKLTGVRWEEETDPKKILLKKKADIERQLADMEKKEPVSEPSQKPSVSEPEAVKKVRRARPKKPVVHSVEELKNGIDKSATNVD